MRFVQQKFRNIFTVCILYRLDDMITCSNIEKDLLFFKGVLLKRFKIKYLGILSWFLGIKFTLENDCIRMSQPDFVGEVIDKFFLCTTTKNAL